jgi:hypothetical protein
MLSFAAIVIVAAALDPTQTTARLLIAIIAKTWKGTAIAGIVVGCCLGALVLLLNWDEGAVRSAFPVPFIAHAVSAMLLALLFKAIGRGLRAMGVQQPPPT